MVTLPLVLTNNKFGANPDSRRFVPILNVITICTVRVCGYFRGRSKTKWTQFQKNLFTYELKES